MRRAGLLVVTVGLLVGTPLAQQSAPADDSSGLQHAPFTCDGMRLAWTACDGRDDCYETSFRHGIHGRVEVRADGTPEWPYVWFVRGSGETSRTVDEALAGLCERMQRVEAEDRQRAQLNRDRAKVIQELRRRLGISSKEPKPESKPETEPRR